MENTKIEKYIDAAVEHLNDHTIAMIKMLPLDIAFKMIVVLGKEISDQKEWKLLTKQMTPTLGDKLLWTIKKFIKN